MLQKMVINKIVDLIAKQFKLYDIMKYVNALFFDSEFKDRLELKIQNSLKKFLSNHKNASKEIANHLKSLIFLYFKLKFAAMVSKGISFEISISI